MSMLYKISLTVALAVAGCAGPGTAQISNPATDPASPQATAAPVASGYQFVPAPAPVSPHISASQGADSGAGTQHGSHDMPGMQHSAHDMPGMQHSAHGMPGMTHGTHGTPPASPQTGKGVQPAPNKPAATSYTCPMHPEVRSTQPGRCPKCGMKLVPAEPQPDGGQR